MTDKDQEKKSNVPGDEGKLEDILNSIRGIINDHKNIDFSRDFDSSDLREDNKDDQEADEIVRQNSDAKIQAEDKKQKAKVINTGAATGQNTIVDEFELLELTDDMQDPQQQLGDQELVSRTLSPLRDSLQNSNKASKESSQILEKQDSEIDQLIKRLVMPLIESWINKNMPTIAEEIIQNSLKNQHDASSLTNTSQKTPNKSSK